MMPADIHDLARVSIEAARASKRRIATAESCTGGLLAAALTEIAGASDVFDRGFIAYSNASKLEALGVPEKLIEDYGAVSAEAAEAMARGAIDHAAADLAVSITGIAGPAGGTPEKPVGLVYIGLADRNLADHNGAVFHYKCFFKGDREDVRVQAVREALKLINSILKE